ncbi:protein piccolo isoform X6 [Ascaphus truei]|uniref:protein piccolo isoform X6 n=1 Tax=Ascaphus truei TaxID=8439 RepID=UPI003F590DCB
MGNEGSMEEGGEGLGASPGAGGGGSARAPAGVEANLSRLSEEERRQISAVMSRAQELPGGDRTERPMLRNPDTDTNRSPRHPCKPPDPGPTGISKSKTVDAFKTEMRTPGRSPSSMSLREPRPKSEMKEEQKPRMMTSFLTDNNPLNVVSSVVNKFNPFDAKSDSEANQEELARKLKDADKEHEKIEALKGNVKPLQQQQQSPKQIQHQQGQVKYQPTDTTKPTSIQQQPSKPAPQQSETRPVSLPQSSARTLTQSSDATKQLSHTKPLPNATEPTKPLAQEPSHSTSAQVPGPKKEPLKQDRPTTQFPPPILEKHLQQSGPPKQSMYPPGGSKAAPQPSEPVKKLVKEPDKLSTKPQGTAKQTVQQAGSTKPPSQQSMPAKKPLQQAASMKQPLQQLGPVKQQRPITSKQQVPPTISLNTKQTQQKPEPTKPMDDKQPFQMSGNSVPNLAQSIKATPQQPEKLSEQRSEPKKQSDQSQQISKIATKTVCPLCNTTELLLNTKEKANYNTCTQCQTTVCSLCGFNPNPHITEIKEWLCLNCQMQRALGMDMTSVPASTPQLLNQKPVPASPPIRPSSETSIASNKKESITVSDQTMTQGPKMPPMLTKQPSVTDSPMYKPKQATAEPPMEKTSSKITLSDKTPPLLSENKPQQIKKMAPVPNTVSSSQVLQAPPDSSVSKVPVSTAPKCSDPKLPDLAKPLKDTHQVEEKNILIGNLPPSQEVQESKHSNSEVKSPPKVETAQLKQDPKKTPTKMNAKLDDKQVPKAQQVQASPKSSPSHKPVVPQTIPTQSTPQPQKPQKSQEQPRRFSLNLGSVTETTKHQPTTPQETVTGKLFGFGASIFSQASSLISTSSQPGAQSQNTHGTAPKQPPTSQQSVDPQKTAKEAVHTHQSPKRPAVKQESKAMIAEKTEQSKSILTAKETEQKKIQDKETETKNLECKTITKEPDLEKAGKIPEPKICPLCKTELNIGSKDPSNFNTCTECKNIVCNLCGFNPTPHLTEVKEWLCLNCQTHRAMSGQRGDTNKMPPPLGEPSKSSPKHSLPMDQPHAHKTTTLPFTAIEKINDQEMKKNVPEVKQTTVPAEHGDQERGEEKQLPISKSEEEEHKSGLPVAAELLPLKEHKQDVKKDIALVTKERTAAYVQSEEKMTMKQDLVIDLSAIVLSATDGETYEERIKAQANRLAEHKTEKEDDKSDTSSSQQQKSPPGLSDTGYSSDGISSSLGEIPSLIPNDEKDFPKQPSKKEPFSHECSPSSPSDLAKLESTVLSILEAQTSVIADEKSRKNIDLYGMYAGQAHDRAKTRTLPITPESYSSEEEELADIQEEDEEVLDENGQGGLSARKGHKDNVSSVRDITARRRRDSLDDSSESENSPVPQRKRRTSNESSSSDDYKHEDSQGSGDEDFIRKQIIEMSADEDASGSEDEEFIRTKLKEISGSESQNKDVKEKTATAKCKRLTKKSSTSYDDDGIKRHSWHDDDDEDDDEETYDESPEPKYRETKSQESEALAVTGGGGLRRFKTIELNSTISNTYPVESEKQSVILYYDEEPELEMESLTDSPEDRSRGEGSSSLHASSFTPGTSPTSVSSLDEDSDSSPSHKKISSESKHRKARHRSHGPVLPTIEDSSEEEELREEEELLKEQEKQRELEQQQRKSSSKKSKKDKDELRAQRRRERPKTPPSNLSPIEDASPTEELRQAAEMEELHRSSCSEYSPSIESEPEGFEISPEKIIEVQKVYKLPTSVSLYSPTDVTAVAVIEKKNGQQSLKSAEEAYEEILYRAKLYKNEKEKDEVFEKEPLYGGMLIEDYIYESLVEDNYDQNIHTNLLSGQENVFEHRVREIKNNSARDICIDVQKIANVENECFTTDSFHSIVPQEDIVSSSYIVPESHEIIILENTEERQSLDADTSFYEFIDCQNMQLTPGASPTQPRTEFYLKTDSTLHTTVDICTTENISFASSSESSTLFTNAISIPDVKITQHFTAEDLEDEFTTDFSMDKQYDSSVSATAVNDECVLNSDTPLEETTSLVFRNAHQQPIAKHDSMQDTYTGSSLPIEHVQTATVTENVISFSQSDSLYYATPTSVCPITRQIYSDSVTVPIETPCSITETTSFDHVIISVPDATQTTVVTVKTEPSTSTFSSELEQDRIRIRKSTEDRPGFTAVSEAKSKEYVPGSSTSSVYSLKNSYVSPIIIECPVSSKHSVTSTAVTDTITAVTKLPSVISTVPSVTSKVMSFFRSSSLDSPTPSATPTPSPPLPPPPPPLPPPTPPKPAIYSKKMVAPNIPLTTPKTTLTGTNTETLQEGSAVKNSAIPVLKTHAPPPPVPPKPSSIPAGLVFSHRPIEGSKPQKVSKIALAELPVAMQKSTEAQQKTAQSLTTSMTLNLSSSVDYKLPSPTSPLSPHSNKSSPRLTKPSQETYVVITLPSEPGSPTGNVTTHTTTCWPLKLPQGQIPQTVETAFSMKPSTKAERNLTSLGNTYTMPSLRKQLITAEVTKTTVSLSKSIVSDFSLSKMSEALPPEKTVVEKSQFKENKKITGSNDVIDLRTLSKMDYKNTDLGMNICMDLSSAPLDVKRQSADPGASSRQISAVQPAIVNLSTAAPVISSVSLVTESVTIMTCSTTLSYTTSLESLVDLGNSMKAPLKLTTSKQFEDGSCGFAVEAEVPINLSLGTPTHSVTCATTKPVSFSPVSVANGCTDISTSQESIDSGVVDLSTTKIHRTMVTVDETSSGIVTEILEDDKPVDLTAGRRAVCCDVVYKLPFGRSCISQQTSTTLPEDRFGYRDDHYQYDRSGLYGVRGVGGMKPSMSDTNLSEAGIFLYKTKNYFDYPIGITEAAVDLTSGKITSGEALDYHTKTTGAYPETRQVISGIGISAPQYSQARMTQSIVSPYGMGSVLRSSNGVVYSSVAAPIPSTFAITTQPGSIFSTPVRDLSSFITSDTVTSISAPDQNQQQPTSYSMLTTTTADASDEIAVAESFPMEMAATTPTDLVSIFTTESESFSEMIEDESTFMMPCEDGKQLHLYLQRELLELEKLKQQRLADELEWERQEIQRFREQETLMVQKKLEELQSMKQHLLYQQEEDRQAQFIMRQETLVQQQLHLEQIQQLQHTLHQQLEEQKLRQMYQYSYDPSDTASPQTTSDQVILEGQFSVAEDGQFWTSDHISTTASAGIEMQPNETWYAVQSEGITQYIGRPGILNSVSEMSLKDIDMNEERQLKKRSSMPKLCGMYDELDGNIQEEPRSYKLIVDSGVQTDDEDGADKGYTGRRRRSKKGVDTSVQTDDEDQDEWDIPTRSRRRSRSGKYSDVNTDVDKVKQFSKVSSIAVQTVAEISVQTEPLGTIRTPSARAHIDAKVEIIKYISAPEKSYKGGSLGCQTETDSDIQSSHYLTDVSQKDKRRPTPLEIGYSSHLRADSSLQVAPSPPKSPKVLYSPISPDSPSKALESGFVPYEKTIVDDSFSSHKKHIDSQIPPPSPKTAKGMQRSMSDPKPLSPTAEDVSRTQFQYSDGYMTTTIQSGTQKKVKRTLPNPPPEEANNGIQSPYSTVGSVSRRRICRTTTMARAKILQDIDRELDLVERESSKLRKKQAELDEEEKEIDAKLRYLEMGINRRKEALLKEREKRERAYLQGVAEERDYMSDSEVNNTRPTRIEGHLGLDRPQTAPQTDFSPYMPPQTQSETQFAPPTSPYTQYQYQTPTLLTQAPTQYPQQSLYQQPLYHQQVSSYQTQPTYQSMSFTSQPQSTQTQQPSYQHQSQMMLLQQKTRQSALDLDSKMTTHYDVIRNQPLIIAPASTDNSYSGSHLGSKYSTLDLRLGLDEKSSLASSPMSSISADSFYADLEHHASRNYILIDDIGELTKGSGPLSSAFGLHEKDQSKTDRLLRTIDSRRTPEVTDFLAPMTTSARLHTYGKADEDSMEDPYELKLLQHQIKQEFRRGTESLDPLTGFSPYYHSDSLYRHFPKTEKYSISRLTLEKQAAKQLPPAILYQKQSKHKKTLIDPKISKFSPIQESRDLEPDYSSYLSSSTSSIPNISSKVRLLQDDITYGLRKNITDQQKFLGPALAQNFGATLSPTMRSSLQDEVDKPYVSGSRSRPSSRPSSVYGLDLSIKRDLSSSSLRLKANEAESLDVSFSHAAPSGRTKPSSLPLSQSRGRIPIVAQNSEEESPLSPVGQPMGMSRAAAGPLPPISADSRDQFGSSHSLPEVQQHMREESRNRGYDRDIAFIMDDFQHAMSDSEDNSFNDGGDYQVLCSSQSAEISAYHLRREETDWFDKPRESRLDNGHDIDRKLADKLSHTRPSHQQEQMNGKPIQYVFPHTRIKLQRDPKDHTVSGNGFGIRVVGGKDIPGNDGDIGAYIAKILPGGDAEQTGRLTEGMQVLEWNCFPLTAKTYEEVQSIITQSCGDAEICVRLDLNMLSDSETPQHLELHDPGKADLSGKTEQANGIRDNPVYTERLATLCRTPKLYRPQVKNELEKTRSPGVDPKQLAAELQKVSQQQTPSIVSSAMEKGSYVHSGTTSTASSAVPSPGQPGSPSVSKKKHSSKSTEAIKTHSHPITGEIQLQVNYDKHLGNLIIHILQARNLVPRDNNGYSDPFVKVYLLPGRGQVMVVQNASAEYKRRTKYVQKSLNPEWNQTVIYKNISMEQLKKKTLEVTVWDYDRFSSNDFLGEVLIDLSNTSYLDNMPRWYPLKEQSESIDHGKSHSGQSSQQVPKPSVIKSRSHGIFPDPSKDMQVPTIEKSHSSPGSSKSSSEGHLRSHGPSRSQSKTSVTQTHLEDAGAAIAAAEAAVQQLRLQPTNDNKDQSQLALKKATSDGSVKPEARTTTHRPSESSVSTASSASSFGSAYSMDSDGNSTTGESNLFSVPRIGKMNQNAQDLLTQTGMGPSDTEGKTQVIGEIKIALKKEMKTDGEQLIVEILQCRNITYKFKSPDHLPDLYVKLYVINIATQKRIIKKKTRVCRHDREPSFNETFRFSMSPAGHSVQILLVSNGGKFMKKTLIGEAYICLDKVDLRKRIVNWHKLLVSATQTH